MSVLRASRNIVFGVFTRPIAAPSTIATTRIAMNARHYSDKGAEEAKPEEEKPAEEDTNGVDAQLKEKDDRIKQLSDQLLYTKAEMQNIQRRAAEEKSAATQFSIAKLAKDLTGSIDVLDLALGSIPEPYRCPGKEGDTGDSLKVLHEFYDGVSLTRKSILDMLRSHGIEQFNPVGDDFDPKLHDALFQAPIPDKKAGSVFECSQVGYMIKDRLLRPAQVGVVQESS
ncbi:GrpE, mitochondrial [Malassezia vespertilionis]|uniref:GrpE protein homolog n=1 Tax=Malassezia vespertilionis TaxID=2020962 RepID=A0A2N1JCS6_9BASI|nr:GrpE, mitochondrial [Malassezia vespertilionis]PKI84344.1 Mge1p [Malassezia vespertilionis]WFD06249.1 GrpE, mitochondrial [Malassezia vespertilionis]